VSIFGWYSGAEKSDVVSFFSSDFGDEKRVFWLKGRSRDKVDPNAMSSLLIDCSVEVAIASPGAE
jgi:hypothetical protein